MHERQNSRNIPRRRIQESDIWLDLIHDAAQELRTHPQPRILFLRHKVNAAAAFIHHSFNLWDMTTCRFYGNVVEINVHTAECTQIDQSKPPRIVSKRIVEDNPLPTIMFLHGRQLRQLL